MGLKEAEGINFKYTTMSLDDVYKTGFKHALQNIERNGGKVNGDNVIIKMQLPVAVRFEKSFDGLYAVEKKKVKLSEDKTEITFDYKGTGFLLPGEITTSSYKDHLAYVFNTELYIDNKLVESPSLTVNFITRRYELCWKYDLPKGNHTVKLKILNPSKESQVKATEAVIYSDQSIDGIKANISGATK